MSDTLADMITRIRNGQKANKVSVKAIFSKLNVNVCSVLKSEGFIDTYEVIGDNKKDILSKVNSFDVVTFGQSKINPNTYILGAQQGSDFIKKYKKDINSLYFTKLIDNTWNLKLCFFINFVDKTHKFLKKAYVT